MANKTIYPFGTGGELPESIGIINDLTTGGANKALSAEMGKVLSEKIDDIKQHETDIVIGYAIKKSDGTTMSSANGIINTYRIDAGKIYYASGRQLTNSSVCSIAYYHGNTFLGSEKDGGIIQTAEDFVKFQLTIPETADYVKVYGNSNAQTPELYVTIGGAVQELVEGRFAGKKLAVIGDSISTIYGGNTPYWKVKDIDVGNTIQSYVTWEDIYGNYRYPDTSHPTGKTIGGVALTLEMVDGELHSFTPVLADVGKEIGVPHHYSGNDASVKVWSQRLCDMTGMVLLANASWSGSAITSIETEGRGIDFTASQAWHPCTIGRCHVRDNEGNFVNPDVIIVYRGTNDLSYSDNGSYPDMNISDVDLMNGFSANTDKIDGEYSFKTGYYMTIQALREAYPNAIIILCTLNVFKRVHYDKFPTRNDVFTLPDMNNAIREIADVTGCPVIELDKDGITFQNCYTGGYITDSATTPTHPNNKGHRVMAERAFSDLTYVLNP